MYFSQPAAANVIDPKNPPSADTLRRWHDKIGGPRDTSGRRVFTKKICQQIKSARSKA
jgi:hypothetical protein